MSYDPRLGGRAQDSDNAREAQKGSVRAARERMQAAQTRTQLPDTSCMVGLPPRLDQLIPRKSSRRRNQPTFRFVPSEDDESASRDPAGPQWPLPNTSAEASRSNPMAPPRSVQRLQPRKHTAQPISDDYQTQHLSPESLPPTPPNYLQPSAPGYGVSYSNGELYSPTSHRSSRPLTTSSAASEASSLGDIPDFPVPEMPCIRRIPSLGPPPSARRGPNSYYTQTSHVSPIVEESEARSAASRSRHGSFASSNVFPMNNEDFYPDDHLFLDDLSSDDETMTSDRGTASPEHDDQSGLVKQSPTLVRQASLGRRTKPSLMTIKSGDSLGSGGKKTAAGLGVGAGMDGASGAMLAARDASPSGLARSISSADSVNMNENIKGKPANYAGSMTPSPAPSQEMRTIGLAERAGLRRPPRLDIDAVRDAEARGSLTSLPDLIRRATKLAANLDRGKTASRLGLDFWESGAPQKRQMRQSGLSDMLAAFPHPGQDTSLRSGSPNTGADGTKSNEKSKKRRRCCGMPMWTFVTLLIVLLFVTAAAIIIPLVLIVLPNQNKSKTIAAQDTQGTAGGNNNPNDNSGSNSGTTVLPVPNPSNNQCEAIITCQNGGIALLNSDRSCNCICINGFTGRTCTNNDAAGCTATSIADTATNATVGTAIPRIVETANKDFKIPLDTTRILSLFSNLALSCAAENALITFDGLASRSISHELHSASPKHMLHRMRSLHGRWRLHQHQAPTHPLKRQTVGQPGGTPQPNSPTVGQPGGPQHPNSPTVGQPRGPQQPNSQTVGQPGGPQHPNSQTVGQPGGTQHPHSPAVGQPGGTQHPNSPTVGQPGGTPQPNSPAVGQPGGPQHPNSPTVGQPGGPQQPNNPTVGQPGGPQHPNSPTVGQPGGPQQPNSPTVGQPGGTQQPNSQTVGQPGGPQQPTIQKKTQSGEPRKIPVSSNVTALDFARIGVLFALQESGDLNTAASAQEAIQNFLAGNRNGNAVRNSVDVGLFEMDLVEFTIHFKNGTTIRAPPQAASLDSRG